MNLKNKKILITGGAQGLGKEIARKIIKLGGVVILLDKNKGLLEKTASELGANFYVCDITSQEEIKKIKENVLGKFQKVDFLINNAGVWIDNEIEKLDNKKRLEAFKVNTIGAINITEEFIKSIKENNGSIVNIISIAATTKFDELGECRTYGATKWGLLGYSKGLRDSFKNSLVRIIDIFPGGFDSNLFENSGWKKDQSHKQEWMLKLEEVADAVLFAISTPSNVEVSELVITKKYIESN